MKPVPHRRLLLSAGVLGAAMWACPAWSQCDVPKYPSFIGPSPEYAGYAVAIEGDLAVAGADAGAALPHPRQLPGGCEGAGGLAPHPSRLIPPLSP